MGLFGDIDTETIPSDPFNVDPGTYACVLTEFSKQTSQDGERHGLAVKWVIEEEGDFEGRNVSDWLAIFPESTELTPAEKQQASNTKKRLLEMGVDEEDMDKLLDEDFRSEFIGTTAEVTVVKRPDKHDTEKFYTNIKSVSLS